MGSGQTIASAARWLARLFSLGGRARRTDWVWFGILCAILNAMIVHGTGAFEQPVAAFKTGWDLLGSYLLFAMLVRRLHDQDRTGWWAPALYGAMGLIFFGLTRLPQGGSGVHITFELWNIEPAPGAASAVLSTAYVAMLLVVMAVALLPPTPGPNRYGPDPRIGDPATAPA